MSDVVTRCEVCQSLLDEEDLFCANCGTESPPRDAAAGDATAHKRPVDGRPVDGRPGDGRVATHNFECSGCGASMSFDAREGKLRCPFCGSVKMNRQEDAKVLAPQRVVEFAVSEDEAQQQMRTWLGRGFFRPADLSETASVVKMTPVYVPYWVFEAKTHTYWTADSSRTPALAKSNWYPVSGEHRGDYKGILVGASGALHPAETSQICPFDISAGREPDAVDLDNATVEQFGVGRKYARPIARSGLEQFESEACSALVPGSSRNVHVNVRVEALAGEPILLPVWIMAYRYKNDTYRFLVNGQTGKSTGKAPYSAMKIVATAAVFIAIVLLALLLLAGLGGIGRHLGLNVDLAINPINHVCRVPINHGKIEPRPRGGYYVIGAVFLAQHFQPLFALRRQRGMPGLRGRPGGVCCVDGVCVDVVHAAPPLDNRAGVLRDVFPGNHLAVARVPLEGLRHSGREEAAAGRDVLGIGDPLTGISPTFIVDPPVRSGNARRGPQDGQMAEMDSGHGHRQDKQATSQRGSF